MKRLDRHMNAAMLLHARGDGAVTKGERFYCERLGEPAVRDAIRARCRELGIRGQFESGQFGRVLRLWAEAKAA